MKPIYFFAIHFVTLWSFVCNGQPTNSAAKLVPLGDRVLPFVEKHDLNAGDARGYVTLNVGNVVITNGGRLSIEVRFVNTGLPRDFYNPYFTPRIAPPAQIALYDNNRDYVCDLLSFYVGSIIPDSWDDWVYIPGGGSYIGFTMPVHPSYARRPLPPGDYYLQFIYYKAFIALDQRWADTDQELAARRARLKDFDTHFDPSELFRSNPIKFTIVK